MGLVLLILITYPDKSNIFLRLKKQQERTFIMFYIDIY